MQIEIPEDATFYLDTFDGKHWSDKNDAPITFDQVRDHLIRANLVSYHRPSWMNYGYLWVLQVGTVMYRIRTADYAPSETYLSM